MVPIAEAAADGFRIPRHVGLQISLFATEHLDPHLGARGLRHRLEYAQRAQRGAPAGAGGGSSRPQ